MFCLQMDKRGQFYIILAIIISLAFFSLIIQDNKVQESILIQDFNDVSNNYVQEAPNVANYGIYNNYNNDNIKSLLSDYSSNFLYFARQKNPSIELIYIYSNGTNVTVRSYTNETTYVTTENSTTQLGIPGAEQQTINNINLNVAGKDFTQQVPLQIKNFGDQFSTADFPNMNNVVLNLGGVVHNFNLDTTNGPQLSILIRSQTGSAVQVYQKSGTNIFPVKI